MALDGSPILGESCVLSVESPTTPGTYVEVANMNRYSKNSARAVKTTRVFNKVTPVRSVSKTREQTGTISGLESPGDAGQTIVNGIEAAGTLGRFKVLVDGTAGFTQQAYVRSYKNDAGADDGDLRELSYELEFVGNPTAVAGYDLL